MPTTAAVTSPFTLFSTPVPVVRKRFEVDAVVEKKAVEVLLVEVVLPKMFPPVKVLLV